MALGNTTLNQEQLEKIMSVHMERPESAQAFKYKDKTFNTFKEALRAEFYDKFEEVIKAAGGGQYLSYNKDAILNSVDEIKVLCEEYHNYVEDNEHPTIQSCVHEAASDFVW